MNLQLRCQIFLHNIIETKNMSLTLKKAIFSKGKGKGKETREWSYYIYQIDTRFMHAINKLFREHMFTFDN